MRNIIEKKSRVLLTIVTVVSFTLIGISIEQASAEQLFLTEAGEDITMKAVNDTSDDEGNATGNAIEGVNRKSGTRGTLGHKDV